MFSKLSDIAVSLGHHISLSDAKECLAEAVENRAKYIAETEEPDAEELFYLDHEVGLYSAIITDIKSFM